MVMTGSVPKISTILRLHTMAGMAQLERALFSLAGQRHGRIEPLILLQRFTPEDAAAVERMAARLPWQAEADAPRVLNPEDLPEGDQRAELLTRGIAAATGTFVGFLDYDDYLYPNAYEALLGRFAAEGCEDIAAAMGGVMVGHEREAGETGFIAFKRVMRQQRNKYLLFFENLYPIHSFLIRRSALDGVVLPAGLRALEDYHLLLQVLSRHPWDTELLDTPICEYVQRVVGESTQQTVEADTAPHWGEARDEVARWKRENTAVVSVEQLAQLAQGRDRAVAPASGAPDGPPQIIKLRTLDDAPLATPMRNFLPFLTLMRRRKGAMQVTRPKVTQLMITGEIPSGTPRQVPQVVLLYRRRRRFPLLRYRFVGAVYVDAPDAEGICHYATCLETSVLGKIQPSDAFTAYAICANRRVYRVGSPVHIMNGCG